MSYFLSKRLNTVKDYEACYSGKHTCLKWASLPPTVNENLSSSGSMCHTMYIKKKKTIKRKIAGNPISYNKLNI